MFVHPGFCSLLRSALKQDYAAVWFLLMLDLTGYACLPGLEFTYTPEVGFCGSAPLQRKNLGVFCCLNLFRICLRCVWAACPTDPTRLSTPCLGRGSHTCRRGHIHLDRWKRWTISLVRNNGLLSCQAENLYRKTKRVFREQVHHRSWTGRFRHHRNTPRTDLWWSR